MFHQLVESFKDEEQGHKAVCPGVGAEHVEDAQFWATEPDPSQELELEVGPTVQLALDVVLEHQLRQLVVL